MTILAQVLPSVEPHALGDAIVVAVVTASQAWNHFKGKRRDHKNSVNGDTLGRIERSLDGLARDVDDLTGDVRDLKAFVVGPDGQNGLRSDVKEIKERVIGLEDRERDRLHGPYTKV